MIKYKIDVIKALKEKGYQQKDLIDNRLIPSATFYRLKHGKDVNFGTLNTLCMLLRKQPGDIIECEYTDEEKIKYF